MTNEELAVRVQSGESALLLELWQGVRLFALQQANRRLRLLRGRGGAELEDLLQAAFLALFDTLERWRADRGAFLTLYGMCLKTAFSEASGGRTVRQSRDPLNMALSLDSPLGDEEDAATLGELLPDPAAEEHMGAVEEMDRLSHIRLLLNTVLDELPPEQAAEIRAVYYLQAPVKNRKAHEAALRTLRHPRISRRLMALR